MGVFIGVNSLSQDLMIESISIGSPKNMFECLLRFDKSK